MKKVNRMGFWFALFAIFFGVAYSVVQILSVLQTINTPYAEIGMFVPSLILAPCFLMVVVCLHVNAVREVKAYSLVAICFAVLYVALVSLVYFTQLASVIPRQLNNQIQQSELLFSHQSFMVAVDCIGYGYMSIAALFIALAYKKHKWLFVSMLFHGLLAPVIIASFFFPVLLFIGALWMISFPFAMVQALFFFKHMIQNDPSGISINETPKLILRKQEVFYENNN